MSNSQSREMLYVRCPARNERSIVSDAADFYWCRHQTPADGARLLGGPQTWYKLATSAPTLFVVLIQSASRTNRPNSVKTTPASFLSTLYSCAHRRPRNSARNKYIYIRPLALRDLFALPKYQTRRPAPQGTQPSP